VPTNCKRIDNLFLQFAAFYGQVWRSQLKEEGFIKYMKQQWQEALSEFDDATLSAAVNDCLASKEFPPTLPQLIDFCRDVMKRRRSFFKRAETPLSTNSLVAKEELTKMKTFLNIKP
jgi:hypothetical protein